MVVFQAKTAVISVKEKVVLLEQDLKNFFKLKYIEEWDQEFSRISAFKGSFYFPLFPTTPWFKSSPLLQQIRR